MQYEINSKHGFDSTSRVCVYVLVPCLHTCACVSTACRDSGGQKREENKERKGNSSPYTHISYHFFKSLQAIGLSSYTNHTRTAHIHPSIPYHTIQKAASAMSSQLIWTPNTCKRVSRQPTKRRGRKGLCTHGTRGWV